MARWRGCARQTLKPVWRPSAGTLSWERVQHRAQRFIIPAGSSSVKVGYQNIMTKQERSCLPHEATFRRRSRHNTWTDTALPNFTSQSRTNAIPGSEPLRAFTAPRGKAGLVNLPAVVRIHTSTDRLRQAGLDDRCEGSSFGLE
jgi:hypothetical protein